MSIRIQDRDRFLLELLANDFLLLTRAQIQQIIPWGLRRANQRLAKLTAHGLLEKREPEDPLLLPQTVFYHLGENAADALEASEEPLKERRTRAKNFGESYLRHLHLINSVHIHFLTAKADEYRFLNWTSYDNTEWAEVRNFKLRPDGFVRFRKDGREFCYFIEVDRGTERGESIRKKIAEYNDYDLRGDFWQTFKRDWFRVLFITTEESRCRTLAKLFPSDTFWTAPVTEVLSKSLFDGYWMSPDRTLLPLHAGPNPKRLERIAAQKEQQLFLLAPSPPVEETRQQETHRVPTAQPPAVGIGMKARWKKFRVPFWWKVAAGIAVGTVITVLIGIHLYRSIVPTVQTYMRRTTPPADQIYETTGDTSQLPPWVVLAVAGIVGIAGLAMKSGM